MTYKTINWATEARRIARAFEVEECGWHVEAGKHVLTCSGKRYVFLRPDLVLTLVYNNQGREFIFSSQQAQKWPRMGIVIGWDGAVLVSTSLQVIAPMLSRAFFYLGCLSSEVEAVLGVTISAHQKAEWLLEYDERTQL